MKKINIVKKNTEFKRIMDLQKVFRTNDFLVFIEKKNNIKKYKFGISVSKKLGNAVLRNKLKRQIKSIIDKKDYKNNFNCIIILKKPILNKTYLEKEENLFKLIDKLDILKEKNEN